MRSTKSLLHRANTGRLSEAELLITGTGPILLDAHDAGLLLGVTGAGIERMVSDGRLEDMTPVGERRYFRASQVRELLLALSFSTSRTSKAYRPPLLDCCPAGPRNAAGAMVGPVAEVIEFLRPMSVREAAVTRGRLALRYQATAADMGLCACRRRGALSFRTDQRQHTSGGGD
jgi:hypothetical protein